MVLSATYEARALRRHLGDADGPGPAAVPAGHRPAARPRALQRDLRGGHGDLRARSPRSSSRSRSTRRSSTSPGAVRLLGSPRGHRPAGPRHRRTTSRASPARSGSPRPSSSPSSPPAWPSPTAWSSCRATRSCRSCTSCRSARCGAWASAPRRRCAASACAPSPTSRTPRSPPCVRGLGDAAGHHLHELAWGRDPRPVEREQREKSIGSDETFAYDIDDPAEIHRRLLALSERTAARMRAAGMTGRTVTLKVRFADFTTITRSRTLRDPTDVGRDDLRGGRRPVRRPGPAAGPDPAGRGAPGEARRGRAGAHPGGPRRARARLARCRPGRRPGQLPVRCGVGATGQSHRT